MANKFITKFKERRAGVSGAKTKSSGRVDNDPPKLQDSPPGYKPAGPVWGTSFNRAVKAPVVKTRTKKYGVD